MQKIGHSTSTANSVGEFTEGNAGGVPPTLLKAAWLNAVQRELISLIEGSGLELDAEDFAQVLKAVRKLIEAAAQPLDATLTALAGLTTAADQLIYSTGVDKFAVAPLTAFARLLLDAADDAAARATLKAAPLDSPALTGTPTAPTAAAGTNNTQIATTAFVRMAVAALVNSSPAALDTLQELAAALGNDPNFATTMTNALANKQPLDGTLTALAGLTTAPNQLVYATGADQFAVTALTAFARALLDDADAAAARATLGAAPLHSPALTGTPTAPTAAAGTNNTQIATTAFVRVAVAALVNSSPAALDTLQELAAALGNDPNFATTMTNALAGKLGKTETAAKATTLASNIVINGTSVNAGSNVTISAAATAASVMAANAAANVGAVGTYALLADKSSTARYAGDTVAGGLMRFSSTNGTEDTSMIPAGTWRCMGRQPSGGYTVFLRIS